MAQQTVAESSLPDMANNDLPVDTLSPRHLLVQLVQRLVDSDFLATFEQTHEAMENIDHLMEIFHHGGSSQEEEDNRQLASVPSFSKHSGLSDDCSNQLCHYIEDELSCKGIGFDLKKICARYLLGKMYGCGDYPHAEYDIYNAPSVCLTEYTGFLKILASAAKGNTAAFQSIIEGYLYDANFEEDTCGRRCYQNFQTDSNNFLLSCSKELATHNKSYPLVYQLRNYQPFRNQACDVNSKGANCWQSFSSMSSSSDSTSSVSPFNMQCNYYNSPTYNTQVLKQFCATFSAMDCCANSGFWLLSGNQMSTNISKFTVLPPCLANYLSSASCTSTLSSSSNFSLKTLCAQGSMASQTVFQTWFTLPHTAGYYTNVYDKSSLIQAQGLLTAALVKANSAFASQPYNLQTSYPFQVRIIGYSYSNGTEVLTPETGIPAWPVGSDYTSSTTGNFTYQIYLQNMESSEISTMQAVLKSASLPTLLAAIFHAPTGSVKTSTSIYTWTAGAEPTVLESNGATTSSGRMLTLTIASMIAVVTMTLLR
eukprot:gene5869-6463_t